MPRTALRRPRPAETAEARTAGSLQVCGELDFLTAQQVRARIEALAPSHRVLTVDLTGAWLYDRFALDTLLQARNQARHAGCELVFTHAPTQRLARPAVRGGNRRRLRSARMKRETAPSRSMA